MTITRIATAMGLALGLAGCAVEAPTRTAPEGFTSVPAQVATTMAAETPSVVQRQLQYDVKAVEVVVPGTLRVSEANVYYPIADIVWRGEPRGNRHRQVGAIFEEAAARATADMTKGQPVIAEIEVTRFHSLTEKTRYSFGGVHSLKFKLTVKDAATGAVIDGPRVVVADVKASGGAQAIADDEMGQTQRVVILDRLSQVIRRELSAPAGGAAPDEVPTTRADSDLRLTVVPLAD